MGLSKVLGDMGYHRIFVTFDNAFKLSLLKWKKLLSLNSEKVK